MDKQHCNLYCLFLQSIQRAQVAAPRLLPSLPTAITPSNYATPQSSLIGQDAKSHIPLPETSTSSCRDPIKVDLDDGFDRQDLDDLVELKLPLPSGVYETDTIPQTLNKIKTYNKSIGKFLGIGPSSKKISNAKKIQLESQRDTLKQYRDRVGNTESAENLVAPDKSGEMLGRCFGYKKKQCMKYHTIQAWMIYAIS